MGCLGRRNREMTTDGIITLKMQFNVSCTSTSRHTSCRSFYIYSIQILNEKNKYYYTFVCRFFPMYEALVPETTLAKLVTNLRCVEVGRDVSCKLKVT